MSRIANALSEHRDKIYYVLVGGWNTVFGYGAFAVLYYFLSSFLSYVLIITISYIISITNAFVGYRFFVFKSKGNWIKEYLRFYVVYGGAYVVNIVVFPVFVNILNVNAYIAQILINIIIVIASYATHKNYSFKSDDI